MKNARYSVILDIARANNGVVRVDDPALLTALGETAYRLPTYIGDIRRKEGMTVDVIKSGRVVSAYVFSALSDGAGTAAMSVPAPSASTAKKPVRARKTGIAAVSAPVALPSVDVESLVSQMETSQPLTLTANESSSKSELLARLREIATGDSALAKVPVAIREFVPFGQYDVVHRIVSSRVFCPIFITGHSGNGKTLQVEQACASANREFLRINVTAETDEDALIGGFRLKNGNTVFEFGPIVQGMLRGAVVLLDEIDLAGPKILCLQSLMEGKPLVIKPLGIAIAPAPGFTIVATANTKGRGSDDGKYIGTNLLNEAFLERFPLTIEQAYPSLAVEKKILAKTYESFGGTVTEHVTTFVDTLCKWAEAIRMTFDEGGIEDVISTRRLCHIMKAYHIFQNETQVMALCLNRFDKQVQAKFLDLYAKLSPSAPVTDAPVTV